MSNILLVEDDPLIFRSIKNLLEAPYCPHRAVKIELLLDSAKQALENAQQNSEDCYRVYHPKSSSVRSIKTTSNLVELARHQDQP